MESDTEIPIFRPDIEEFAHFQNFIKKLERMNICFAKVSIFLYTYYFVQSTFRHKACVTLYQTRTNDLSDSINPNSVYGLLSQCAFLAK